VPKFEIKAEAEIDLDEILEFSVRQFGVEVAENYVLGIYDSFDRLLESPRIGAPVEGVEPVFRSIGFRSHRIFYVYENDTVLIVRILHKARDAEAALN
jgi:toxin ParE1/3/4